MNVGRWHQGAAAAAGGLVLAAGLAAIHVWLASPRIPSLAERHPEADPGAESATAPAVDLEGRFETFDGGASSVAASWPGFRGAEHDNIVRDSPPLADRWPEGGPPVLWSLDLGDGHAGAAVRHGRVYILDYDEERREDALRCFSFDDGRELWRRAYAVDIRRNHGISRTVPAVSDRHVVSIGPRCHVLCVDALTGEFRWGMDLVADHGTKEPLWYTGQCPLIEGETVVLAPGGRSLMMGVDAATGRILWETPNGDGWTMSHASIIPMEFGGRRMAIYPAIGGVAGVAMDGPNPGEVLWSTTEWKNAITSPSAVVLPEGRILLTAGYGGGGLLLQLRPAGGKFEVGIVWRVDKAVFASEQQTPIYYRDHLFSVMPNDAGGVKRQLVCHHPRGERIWASGADRRFGLGPFLVADDKILILDDGGTLTLARASVERYEELARADVLPNGRDAWGPMALVDGRLLARESKRMVCLDLRAP